MLKKPTAHLTRLFFFQHTIPIPQKHKSKFFPALPTKIQKIFLYLDIYCPENNIKNKNNGMTVKESFGEHIKRLREEHKLPLRKVASVLDLDPSTLSKIERGERTANKEMVPLLAELFAEEEKELSLILFSDKVAYQLIEEENPNEILKVAEEKIQYLKNKNLKQGSLDFK
jgi:HTH-type transcriptional regulator, competence development regulator